VLGVDACCILQQASIPNTLANNQLGATAKITLKELIQKKSKKVLQKRKSLLPLQCTSLLIHLNK
jgi:hypothetical protein